MKTRRVLIWILLWMLCLIWGAPQTALATEGTDWQEELDGYDFSQLEQVLQDILPDSGLTFRQVTEQLMAGNMEVFWKNMGQYAKQMLWGRWSRGGRQPGRSCYWQ